MKTFRPTFVGLLIVGIVFNGLLCSFSIIGLPIWEALYLTGLVLIGLLSLGVRWLIHQVGRSDG